MTQPFSGPESKKALVEAFDHVLKAQAEERERLAAARTKRRPTAITWIMICTLLFAGAYLWLEKPIWLFPAGTVESLEVRDASLRISLANAARHVEYFRKKNGRRPATLDETGTRTSRIVYELNGSDGYLLHGENGPVRLTLRSTDSLAAFVGKSFEVIARRPR